MEILEKILTYLGGATGVVAIVVAIAQACGAKWLDWWFIKKEKDYQEKLTRTTNELLEKLRIEYGSVYSKRTAAIEGIYKQMFFLRHLVNKFPKTPTYCHIDDEKNETIKDNTVKTAYKLYSLIGVNLIYFNEVDSARLIKIRDTLFKFLNENSGFEDSIEYYREAPDNDPRDFDTAVFLMKNKHLLDSEEMIGLMDDLLKQFRYLIGVETKSE